MLKKSGLSSTAVLIAMLAIVVILFVVFGFFVEPKFLKNDESCTTCAPCENQTAKQSGDLVDMVSNTFTRVGTMGTK